MKIFNKKMIVLGMYALTCGTLLSEYDAQKLALILGVGEKLHWWDDSNSGIKQECVPKVLGMFFDTQMPENPLSCSFAHRAQNCCEDWRLVFSAQELNNLMNDQDPLQLPQDIVSAMRIIIKCLSDDPEQFIQETCGDNVNILAAFITTNEKLREKFVHEAMRPLRNMKNLYCLGEEAMEALPKIQEQKNKLKEHVEQIAQEFDAEDGRAKKRMFFLLFCAIGFEILKGCNEACKVYVQALTVPYFVLAGLLGAYTVVQLGQHCKKSVEEIKRFDAIEDGFEYLPNFADPRFYGYYHNRTMRLVGEKKELLQQKGRAIIIKAVRGDKP